MKSVKATLITGKRRQAASFSVDLESSEETAGLVVEGVARTPDDLPAGAYLELDDPEMADLAAIAGYTIEPPHTVRRRVYGGLGKFYAIVLLGGAAGSVFWAVREALEMDLLGALAWLGLGAFVAILGIYWWIAGEDTMLYEDAQNRFNARGIRGWLRSRVGRR